jgi:D-lactate dehydrogenase
MKIFAYEVREDEKKAFDELAREYHVDLAESSDTPSLENIKALSGFDGATFLGQASINRSLLEAFKEAGVRFLSTRTIGYDHIDLNAAKELGIQVCNSNYPPNGVADFTVMMILMSLRHYKQAMWRGYVNDFSLKGLQGRDLKDMTVGIMGTGRIGLQVIRNLSGFGCRILAYDVFQNEKAKEFAEYVDLDTLYRESDIISLHMPLLPSTHHIIDSASISKMKDGVVLINCARGELMDINALVDGIESTKIGALGMDTLEGEEGIIHADRRSDIIANRNWFYLHQFSNVIMTQHMAFYTEQAVDSMVRCGIEGIVKMAQDGAYATKLV